MQPSLHFTICFTTRTTVVCYGYLLLFWFENARAKWGCFPQSVQILQAKTASTRCVHCYQFSRWIDFRKTRGFFMSCSGLHFLHSNLFGLGNQTTFSLHFTWYQQCIWWSWTYPSKQLENVYNWSTLRYNILLHCCVSSVSNPLIFVSKDCILFQTHLPRVG